MIIECILCLIVGILIGSITGLLPGIHINLVASFILLHLSKINSEYVLPLAVFVISLSITHIFVDFIPTTLLGVPNEDNLLAVLPAHRMVKEGQAFEAIKYGLLGCLFSTPLFLIITPIYLLSLEKIYLIVETFIPFVIIFSIIYLILRESNILLGLTIFVISGILGYSAFNLPIKEPLLPLLTGLFGLSSIFLSLSDSNNKIVQEIEDKKISYKMLVKPTIISGLITPLLSFLPAIGSGHMSLLSSEISNQNSKQFIFTNGLVSTLTMSLSVVVAYIIGKTRTGSAVAINSLLEPFDKEIINLIVVVLAIIVVSIVAYLWSKFLAIKAISMYDKINYNNLAMIILSLVLIFNILLTNSLGLVLLISSTSLGIICIKLNVKRIQLMGCLLIPTLIYYLA